MVDPKIIVFAISLLVPFVTALASQDPPSDPFSCSPSRPCALGCCSKGGVCGLGPTFCGKGNCTSSCDQKSECDPGWGKQWASAEKCPLNVCCSKFGFCGTTKDFCGNKEVIKPSCSTTSANRRIVGYYEGWSMTRACDQMVPESIPAGVYTHINFAFAFVDPHSFVVSPMSDLDRELYPRFTNLKEANPGLQTWISIGGWSMNDPDQPTFKTFSDLAGSKDAQTKFFTSLISFMTQYGFDGVDIDWEYPVAPERGGKPADFANYPSFLSNLKAALGSGGHNYGLSITVPSSYWYMQHFDLQKIQKIVDFFNVMTYDLHGTWDSTDKYIGPIVNAHTNLTEIDLTMDLFWRNTIDPKKINMGLGFYGRSFTLSDPKCSNPGCAFNGGGTPEIEEIIAAGAKPTLDKEAAVKQVVWDRDQWVSYDDEESFGLKIDYANSKCLGGLMVWAISTDDDKWKASLALASGAKLQEKSLWGGGKPKTQIASCTWSDCAKNPQCPATLSPATSGKGKNGIQSIWSGCASGESRYYCCPSNDMPTCHWQGTWAFCTNSACADGEVAVASDSSGDGHTCWANHKNLCCASSKSDAQAGQCKWEGSGPFCSAIPFTQYGCNEKDRKSLTYDSYGAGGEAYCYTGYKSLCCTQPPPYQGCAWYSKPSGKALPGSCATSCPDGKQIVAVDPSGCSSGTSQYFCCDEVIEDIPDVSATPPQFCVAPADSYLLDSEHDQDGNPADFLELTWYDEICFDIPNTADPDIPSRVKRSTDNFVSYLTERRLAGDWAAVSNGSSNATHDILCFDVYECYSIPLDNYSHVREWMLQIRTSIEDALLPRPNPGRLIKMCYSAQASSSMQMKSTLGVTGLANAGRTFQAATQVVKTGICYSLPLFTKQRLTGVDYVAEHVTELQTPGMFSKAMSLNKYLGGSQILTTTYDWSQIFRQNGVFYQTWNQLGVKAPIGPSGITGTSPADMIANAFGTTKDITNTLILDASTNSLKKSVWPVFKNIISDKKWNGMNVQSQIEAINRLYQTLPEYMNQDLAQKAMQYTLDTSRAAWGGVDAAARLAGAGFKALPGGVDFQDIYNKFAADHFNLMQSNLQDHIKSRIQQTIDYLGSTAAQKALTKATCDALIANLKQKLVNLAANVIIKAPK